MVSADNSHFAGRKAEVQSGGLKFMQLGFLPGILMNRFHDVPLAALPSVLRQGHQAPSHHLYMLLRKEAVCGEQC